MLLHDMTCELLNEDELHLSLALTHAYKWVKCGCKSALTKTFYSLAHPHFTPIQILKTTVPWVAIPENIFVHVRHLLVNKHSRTKIVPFIT